MKKLFIILVSVFIVFSSICAYTNVSGQSISTDDEIQAIDNDNVENAINILPIKTVFFIAFVAVMVILVFVIYLILNSSKK